MSCVRITELPYEILKFTTAPYHSIVPTCAKACKFLQPRWLEGQMRYFYGYYFALCIASFDDI